MVREFPGNSKTVTVIPSKTYNLRKDVWFKISIKEYADILRAFMKYYFLIISNFVNYYCLAYS